MSVDLVELGQSIGEAQATADAALETAQIAEAEATLAVAEDDSGTSASSDATAHCGPDCPCHTHQRELEAMLVALSDKHDEDMDTIARALDYLLGEEVEETEEDTGVEVINPEEEEANGSESTGHQSSAEGHGAAGAGDTEAREPAQEEAKSSEERHSRRAPASRRIRFARGRR